MERARLWKSSVPVAANLLLGIPAVVPLFLIWYLLSNYPLADLGWTQREPTENDGILPGLIIAVPVVGVFGIVWALLNLWMRDRLSAGASASSYWTLAAALTLAPCGLLIAFG
ncbi:hypothetical protein HXS80_20200 [Streptomyces sp. CB04723]|uniref:hypothetical protein n=1 Tax=Streptomyces TaxID=1883 RepID=UPI0015C4C0C0|nr:MULTISPECIES: hypothetical protein [Streptomyces]MDW4900243.1 hypothetical protein [Streptomyces californicus]QLG33732.1 hypothetical protein HXS80_20200 [Streptomyces sp. CB04723]